MTITNKMKAYVAELADACERGDLDWFMTRAEEETGVSVDKYIVEMAMHKATYINLGVSEQRRRESQKWLAERGLHSSWGDPITVNDPLPSRFDGCH